MFSPRKVAAAVVLAAVCSGGVALSALPANAATPAPSSSSVVSGQFVDGNFDAANITNAYLVWQGGSNAWTADGPIASNYALSGGAWSAADTGKNSVVLSDNHPGQRTGNTVYQDVRTVPGQTIVVNYAHLAISGTDTMTVAAGAPGKTLSTISTATDASGGWKKHQQAYTVPAGQTVTRFQFTGVSTTSQNQVGNGLDSVSITLAPASAYTAPTGGVVVLSNSVANSTTQRTVVWRNGQFDTEIYAGKAAFGAATTSVADGTGVSLAGYTAGDHIVVTTESATYTATATARTVLTDTIIK